MKRFYQTFGLTALAMFIAVLGALLVNPNNDNLLFGKSFLYAEQPLNVVKVTIDHGDTMDMGTGSLIRGDLILTAWHVVTDYRAGDKVIIEFRDGMTREGNIVKTDKTWDLAVIKIKPVLYPVCRPASKAVVKGQTVNICGFPHGKDYHEVRGRVRSFRAPSRTTPNYLFTVHGKSISGMSGGPVFNDGGEVVGVLFGSQVYSNCTGLQAIKNFLRDVK